MALDRLQNQVAELAEILTEKCDSKELHDFRQKYRQEVSAVNSQLEKKSNIKDVCALLDMKSNIDDVNKALTDMHHDVGGKVAKEEFQT